MYYRPFKSWIAATICLLTLFIFPAYVLAIEFDVAAPDVQSLNILKVVSFATSINKANPVTFVVIGAPDIAKELKKYVGQAMVGYKIGEVLETDKIPSKENVVVYVGKNAKADEIIKFTRANKILSTTGYSAVFSQGISVGVGLSSNKKLEIILSLTASKAEGVIWNPAFQKIALTVN